MNFEDYVRGRLVYVNPNDEYVQFYPEYKHKIGEVINPTYNEMFIVYFPELECEVFILPKRLITVDAYIKLKGDSK